MEEIMKNFFLWKLDRNLLSNLITTEVKLDPTLENLQSRILANTTQNPIYQKFPIHPESKSSFFKTFLKLLIEHNVEILDEVYENSVPVVCNDGPQKYFKSYFDNKGTHLCSLVETKEFVSHGTTGLKTWPAAEYLFAYLLEHLEPSQKTILELGSGVGFLGIATSVKKSDIIQEWIFTDHSDAVLSNVAENASLNGIKHHKIVQLDWEQEIQSEDFPDYYDLIVGTDIVFDTRIIEPLCRTLKRLMSAPHHPKAIIANVERNQDTKEAFEVNLRNSGLDFIVQRNDDDNIVMLLYHIEMQGS